MRSTAEIQRQIDGLMVERETYPEFNFFGDNNWEKIDMKISMLNGFSTYDDYSDAEYEIESVAYEVQKWLDEEDEEDLFSD